MDNQINKNQELNNFLKDNKYVLILLGILLFGFAVRIYFFNITSNQPVWWDEADYLTLAKKFGKGILPNTPTVEMSNPRRPFLMPLLWAGIYKLGLNEMTIRLMQFLLSMFGILFTYLIGKEMFNKKVGLIASFLMSCFWLHLFFTNRLLIGLPAATFCFGCFYFFWKGYVNNKGTKYIWLAGIFLGLSVFTRAASLIMVGPIIVLLLMKDKLKFLKNKNIWISIFLLILVLSPFLIWLSLNYENPIKKFTGVGEGRFAEFGFSTLIHGNTTEFIKFFPTYLQIPFLIVFLFGLILFLDVFLGLDLIFKKEGANIRKKIFILLWILIPLLFFGISTSKSYMEPRYLLYIFPAVFIITALGFLQIFTYISKHSKETAYIVISLILISGMYYQFDHADSIISGKKDSYLPVKDSSLWIKENSKGSDVFFTQSVPQSIYYSERKCYGYTNEKTFVEQIKKLKPKYMVVSVFEYHPEWVYNYPEKNNLKTAKAYFLDPNNPSLIIYEL